MTFSDMLLLSVGNTRTRAALWSAGKLQPSRVLMNADSNKLHDDVLAAAATADTVLLASVNEPVAEPLTALFQGQGARLQRRLIRVTSLGLSDGLGVPIQHNLIPPITVGVDRLLNALAAHNRSGEACVVIDAGTAVTVDFVDGWGVFQGGCIAPGLNMALWALHRRAPALPAVEPGTVASASGPLGRTTVDAMALGCAASIRGMVRLLLEQYAELNGSYPRVIATGGDAPLLFENDELIEHIVPDLTLVGMRTAWEIVNGVIEATPPRSPATRPPLGSES